jgi:hypothetical protein
MFYPGTEGELRRLIGQLAPKQTKEKFKACGVVVPHAGYVYSGTVAAQVYASIESAQTFVLLGPNHYMAGSAVAVSEESWSTPLGTVEVDLDLIKRLDGIIDRDENAHRQEHSIEVQVPFLQYFFRDFKIVPVAIGMQDYDTVKEVAAEIIRALDGYGRSAVIVASSDFTHYEDADVAKKKDATLIGDIERLDVPALYDDIYRLNATCCGYGPIAAMTMACVSRGAKKGELIRYATSGDVTGDRQVVGYAGIAVV